MTDGAPSVASLPCRAYIGAYIINTFFPHFAKIKKNLGSNKAQSNFYQRTDGAPSVASLPWREYGDVYYQLHKCKENKKIVKIVNKFDFLHYVYYININNLIII